MSSETQRQKLIIDDFKARYPDGMGIKQNAGGFLSGVADIKLACRELGTWEFECKWWSKMPRGEVILPLTTLQREYGKKCLKAGINWGWIAIFKDGVHNRICAGGSPDQITVDPRFGKTRERGGDWESYNPILQVQRFCHPSPRGS